MDVTEFSGGSEQWNDWLVGNGGGVLQSHEWGEFRKAMGWQIHCFQVADGTDVRLLAMIHVRKLPAGHTFFYCPEGPVVKNGDWQDPANRKAFEALTQHLRPLAKQRRAVFLKIDPHVQTAEFPLDWLGSLGFADSPEDIQPAYVTHVDLKPDEEEILAGMKQKGRYNIRYATKKGVTVRAGTSEADLDTFYALLKETATRQGITYRDRQYFVEFRRHFMADADSASFYFAEYEGKPVAATLVTFFGDQAVYQYGGSSVADRNVYGSYLIQWEAMREAKRRGCTYYNLTGVAHDDDPNNAWAGLRQFKLKFGGPVLELIGARDLVFRPVTYKAFTVGDKGRRFIAKTIGRARTQ